MSRPLAPAPPQAPASGCATGLAPWADPGTGINVYKVGPAPRAVAGWINEMLTPVLKAVRADPKPVEFRPLGIWAGMSAGSRKTNPDGRIQLSTKVVFYSKSELIKIYTHELAHCLIDDAEMIIEGSEQIGMHGHDTCFLATNLALLMRIDSSMDVEKNATLYANSVKFYDIQDAPDFWNSTSEIEWKPKAIHWALSTAKNASSKPTTALEMAVEIVNEYWAWCDSIILEPSRLASAETAGRLKAAQAESELHRLKSDLFLYKSLSSLGFIGFSAVFYLSLARL